MTLYTTTEFAQAFADMLEAQGVPLGDEGEFVADYAEALEGWLGGGEAIPAELAYKLKQTLGYWNGFSSGMVDFLTIPADGGPNGDGTVTIVDGLGVTHTIDSLAKLTVDMAGIKIKGTVPTVGDLPSAGQEVGDLWLVNGVGYVWNGNAWVNIGAIQGPPGDAATIQVGDVTTLPPDQPASVTNSGTPHAAVFDFALPKGDEGTAATIQVGAVTKVGPDAPARVTNVGTSTAAIFDFDIPEGDKGDQGDAATIAVGAVSTVAPGEPASVTNVGTSGAAIFDFDIPQGVPGVAATVAVGVVTKVGPDQPARVENVGTPNAAVFDFDIPEGGKGDAATVAVGDVTTLAPGQPATVDNTGTSGAAVFNFGIPQGDPGEAATITVGTVTTVAPGDPAAVTNSGTVQDAVLDFEIPQGVKGDKGERGDPFTINVVAPFSERSLYDAEPPPFAFLASDQGLVYFRQPAGGWSDGVSIGVDPEEYATKVFAKRAAKKAALIYG